MSKKLTQEEIVAGQAFVQQTVSAIRNRLLLYHKTDLQELAWKEESKQQKFTRTYRDNEVDMEEEKGTKAARTRESLPFGMNIRKAAYKAAFGTSAPALQRYATFVERKVDDLD